MMAFMPQGVSGVLFIDINRAMNTEFVTNALAKPDADKGLQEVISKIGIDPRKDISYLALGMTGSLSGAALAGSLAFAAALFAGASLLFRLGLRRYASASS